MDIDSDQQTYFEYATERRAYLETELPRRLGLSRWQNLLAGIDGKAPLGDWFSRLSHTTMMLCQEYEGVTLYFRKRSYVDKIIAVDIPNDLHELIHEFAGW